MPTTTRRTFFAFATALAAALVAWFAGLSALAAFTDPPAVVVFGPPAVALAAADRAGAPLLTAGAGFVTVRADRPGTVRALYASGAWFVWPVFRAGCLG